MWECLVALSTWAENNSGQIQIIIGVVALILAVLAYRGLLHQLQFSSRQRKFELLSALHSSVADNYKMLYQASIDYSPVVEKFASVEKDLKSKGDPDAPKVTKLREMVEGQKNSIHQQVESLVKYSKSLSEKDNLTLLQLEDYQKQISTITVRTSQIVFFPTDLGVSLDTYLKTKK
jgi:hypothetical protein